jgi:PqqD family protein of HPr-rel-A system
MMTLPRKADGLVISKVGDEYIVYDPAKGKVHVLNNTGAAIWELMDEAKTMEDLASAMSERYSTEKATVAGDAGMFIGRLREAGLVS